MAWAVIEANDGAFHVVPVDEEGNHDHQLNEHCKCRPAWDQHGAVEGTRPLLIHEYIQ